MKWRSCRSRTDGATRRVFTPRDVDEMNTILRERQRSPLAQCCPYGQVGDHLWIRERGWERPERTPQMMREGADTWEPFYYDAMLIEYEAEELQAWGFRRRPSIHMPRWACRTVVEITGIRVERVLEITQDDCLAEGCGNPYTTPRAAYRVLWESINGSGSWESNPWVWVLTFKKVSA